jgi:hypothetical protein
MSTGFLNISQSRWLSASDNTLFMNMSEERLVLLVRPFSKAVSQ